MTKKVLLIDDDADDRELFCDAIEELEYQISCYTASDGRKGLSKLDNGEFEVPDLIFLDINLPGISGWECLLKLKEYDSYRHIPVVMYSTSSSRLDVEKARVNGAFCFFTKPNHFRDLKNALSGLITYLDNDSSQMVKVSSSWFTILNS